MEKKKKIYRKALTESRQEAADAVLGGLIDVSSVLMLSDTKQVLARTSIVGTRLRAIKTVAATKMMISTVDDMQARITKALQNREKWDVAPAVVQMAVKEVKILFKGVRDLPDSTFRLIGE